ncbi:hypothetical protein GH714_024644 [Hevea brasiliensis]|uniref:R3H-associated N-terminal domain-containing protein n=1 Tax=Hevea brasiliensis TaxID=3981 RepID=A0A6A6NIX6_HEVBR|nr:hypothetical protein GH714_024644 [Hevea brasiliensis]
MVSNPLRLQESETPLSHAIRHPPKVTDNGSELWGLLKAPMDTDLISAQSIMATPEVLQLVEEGLLSSPLLDSSKAENAKSRGLSIEKKIEFLESLTGKVSNRRSRRWINDRLLMELVPRLNADEIRGLFAPPPWGDDVPPSPFSMTNVGEWEKFRNIDMDKQAHIIDSLSGPSTKRRGHVDANKVAVLKAWHRIDCRTREALRRSFLTDLIEGYEACIRAFIQESGDEEVLSLQVQDPFHRLLLHGVCEFYNLVSVTVSESKDKESLKTTRIKKKKMGVVDLPNVTLSHFLKMSKEGGYESVLSFGQVDAFTDSAFKGNPAAVCLLEEEKDENWLQGVATEFKLSETCYLTPIADSGTVNSNPKFRLRWFTPVAEVKLCGHVTLAASHALFSNGLVNSSIIEFETLSGILTAKKTPDIFTAAQYGEAEESFVIELNFPTVPLAEFSSADVAFVSRALNGATIIDIKRTTAADDLFVVLPSGKAVEELQPRFDEVLKCPGRGIIVSGVAPPESGFDFYSRFFCPKFRVNEASRRSGKLSIHLDVQNDRVLLRGKAVNVMEGSLLV